MISSLTNIVARRDLLKELVVSELRRSTAGSKLGWLWWFFDPVLMMLVYWGIVAGLFLANLPERAQQTPPGRFLPRQCQPVELL